MITIKELARLANVSQSTVSKALNNKPDVGEETRKKIIEIADKYDFSPNAFGKKLKNKSTENIGIIFCRDMYPISANPFYSRVLEGLEAETAINNRNLILQFVTEQQKGGLPKMVREGQVDGLVLLGSVQKDYVDMIARRNIPVVLVDPKFEFENYSRIVMDNEHGAFLAVDYLTRMGHKKIAFISGDLTRLSFAQRFNGYKKALRYRQIPIEEKYVVAGGMEQGYDYTCKLLSMVNRPTAIFYANDVNAHYGYKAVSDLGLEIPKDVSFVGFDDIDMSRMITPPLTTVRAYKEELGSIAVRTLLNIVEQEYSRPLISVVPVKLIERESVRRLN